MKDMMKLPIVIFALIISCSAHSKVNLSGVLSLLLGENRVEVFKDFFENKTGWYGDFLYGDVVNFGVETDNTIYISTIGDGAGDAKKNIDNPVAVNNISWRIKFIFMAIDDANAYLKLNYGGINIFVLLSSQTIPFPVFDGANDVTLDVEYKNGNVTAKANGINLKTPNSSFSLPSLTAEISTDISSSIEISASAGGADDTPFVDFLIDSITARSDIDN